MKRGIFLLLSLLVLASMVLGACSSAATTEAPVVTEAPAEEPVETEEPVEEPAEEPVAEEPAEEPMEEEVSEPAMASEEDLDAAFSAMLSNMEAYNTIKMDAVMEGMAEDVPPFLLDVRQPEELEENGHIEGAVNIPLRELGQNLDKLPSFDTPIVAYCGSGWRATIAMTALSAMGWEDVKALKNLYSDWVDAGNPVVEGAAEEAPALNAAEPDPGLAATFDEMLSNIPEGWGVIKAEDLNLAMGENPDMKLVDVRRAEELEENGTIDSGDVGQAHVALESLIDNKDMWPTVDDVTSVYCGSGHRSTMAMTMLWAYGYPDVTSLKGGFGGWKEAGFPTEGGEVDIETKLDEAFANMLANMEAYNTTNMDAVMAAMAEDTPLFLLDVRQPEELEEKGYIEGAVNIPLRELGQHLDKLPSFDTPIVAYCGSGWRATIAMTALSAMGWEDVKAMKNTYQEWVDAGNPLVEGAAEEALALNAAEPDPDLAAAFDAMFTSIPEGWGVITAEDLNLAMGEIPGMKLIDGRRAEELAEKGIIDSGDVELTPIALEDMIAKKDMWPAVEDTITTYCGSGHRSTMAATMLWTYGYPDVTSLKGGFGGWAEAGFPTKEADIAMQAEGEGDVEAKLDAGFENMLASMEAYNTTKMDAVNEALAEDQPPFLLDVRTTAELEENGHITGAYHIPLQELAQNLDKLPSFDTPIVAYCGSGWRATIAMTALSAMGWEDVKAMKSTYADWVEAGNAVTEGVPEEAPALNAAEPDADLVAVFDGMLSNVPEGYGVMKAEDLNLLLAENPGLVLIDGRRAEELAENGVIDSGEAELFAIPLEEMIASKDQWPTDMASEIVTYCGSGHRSTMAMTMLWSYLYENVKSLKDGFGGWAEAGLPVAEYEAVQ